jgi:hypothetical protein
MLALLAAPSVAQTPREVLERCGTQDVASTAAALRNAGAVGARLCLDVLLDRRLDPGPAGRSATELALPRFAAELRAELAPRVASESDPAWFARALGLVELAGTYDDASLVCALAEHAVPFAEDGTPFESVPLARRTLARIFARDLANIPTSHDFLARTSEPAQLAITGALSDVAQPRSLALLAEWLARGPEHPEFVVTALSTCARGQRAPFDERVRKIVRGRIESRRILAFRESILCVGWLEDEEAAEMLVELMRHDDAGVRRDAHWSLQRVTGARFAPDAERWSRWLAAERAWREEEFPRLVLALGGEDATASAEALNELLRHTFPRHELARAVAGRVAHLDGRPFVATCTALAQLGSPAALDPLLALDAGERADDEAAALAACLAALRGR